MRIAIISVYYGKLPDYFTLWLLSCRYNQDIDFFLFTDQTVDEMLLPSNVIVHQYSLQEMQKKATAVLGFKAVLHSPYKCCDYKPLYGLIFEEFLNGYDYWGHCDLDMIFGDLKMYFTKYHIEKYDKFLPLGHLSLYRNSEHINQSFKLNGAYIDYRTVFTSKESFGFDEMDGMAAIFYKNEKPFFDKRLFADIDQKHKRFRLSDYCVPKKEKINYKDQIFFWEKGKVFRARKSDSKIINDEFCYIHFQKRKKMALNDVSMNDEAFYVTDSGFYKKTTQVTDDVIRKYNPFLSSLYELYEEWKFKYYIFSLKFNRLKRRIKSEDKDNEEKADNRA